MQGIPVLVLIDADSGALITDGARQAVIGDPEGINFPWYPEPLSTILYSGPLLRGANEVDSKEALQHKVTGIYFSAHWVCLSLKRLIEHNVV